MCNKIISTYLMKQSTHFINSYIGIAHMIMKTPQHNVHCCGLIWDWPHIIGHFYLGQLMAHSDANVNLPWTEFKSWSILTFVVSSPPVLMNVLPNIFSYLRIPVEEYCWLSRNSWNVLNPLVDAISRFPFCMSQITWLPLFFFWNTQRKETILLQ